MKSQIKNGFFPSGSIRSHNLLRHPQPPPHPTIFSNICNSNMVNSVTQYRRNHHNSRLLTLHKFQLPEHEKGYTLDYQVSIKDRDVVCAALEPKIEYWLPQSNLDLLLPPLNAGAFFCYTKKDDISMSPETVLKRLKSSLAGVLSTFYPLAGEIVPNSQGEPEVLCNNNGVEFIHAHADVELKTLDLHHPDETVKGKLVSEIYSGVLSIQLN